MTHQSEYWTKKITTNAANNTIANLTTAFNSTNNPQENMHDEGDNVITQYINIGAAVLTVIGVTTTAGVTWYWYCRSKNAKKAQLQKCIAEIEAEQAKALEDATTENNALLSSTEQDDTLIIGITGDNNHLEEAGTLV